MSKYRLIFLGEINESFQLDAVRDDFKELFRLTDKQTKYIFSGKELTIKKNLSQQEALHYVMRIDEIGGICYIEPMISDSDFSSDVIHDQRIEDRRLHHNRRNHARETISSDRRVHKSRRKKTD